MFLLMARVLKIFHSHYARDFRVRRVTRKSFVVYVVDKHYCLARYAIGERFSYGSATDRHVRVVLIEFQISD